MITLTKYRNQFILFKTHLADFDESNTIKIVNQLSKKKLDIEFTFTSHLNFFIITIETDVTKLKGDCTLYIYKDDTTVYKEITKIYDL
jgi:hypothetical protein